jgi:hypothetical protein
MLTSAEATSYRASPHTVEDLMVAVALALSLELSEKLSPKIIQYLSLQNNCLLLLDNFETPWEPIEGRAKVENFLSLLASTRLGPVGA